MSEEYKPKPKLSDTVFFTYTNSRAIPPLPTTTILFALDKRF